ncbi:MAG: dinitrogenase iron-molybdenum cofactor biosynthesis protein [Candidatus Methanophagaceae archaeon]|nr:MAG: dinitrogenase iron-molybdenum cofactor biosynthesis protein [Methanophagales archaeon]
MKICIPTMGERGLDELVSEHFGRAPTFTVVDLEGLEGKELEGSAVASEAVKVVPNTSEHFGGVGHAPEIISGEGVEVMLCGGLGPRAIQMFEQFGVEVFVGLSGAETVRDAIRAFQAGALHEATDADACREHRH